jgi:hypothetical protein
MTTVLHPTLYTGRRFYTQLSILDDGFTPNTLYWTKVLHLTLYTGRRFYTLLSIMDEAFTPNSMLGDGFTPNSLYGTQILHSTTYTGHRFYPQLPILDECCGANHEDLYYIFVLLFSSSELYIRQFLVLRPQGILLQIIKCISYLYAWPMQMFAELHSTF